PAPPEGGSDPAVVGRWLAPRAWDVVAIHAALLPTGEVLQYSYPWASDQSRARLWNPVTGTFTPVDWGEDLFCSGHSHLSNGFIFVSGGNDKECEFQGRVGTQVFDPFTRVWTQQDDMIDGRWYPSHVAAPDGRVFIFSGLSLDCETNAEMEIFTPGAGVEMEPLGHRYLALYPHLFVLTDGRIAHTGPEHFASTFDITGPGWQFAAESNFGWRGSSSSVLLPGRPDEIMIVGGDSPITNTAEIIDFTGDTPSYRFTSSMHHPRAHADALILPDQTVFVVGGGTNGLYEDPINVPERFDPVTETWQEMAPHIFGRMYHSTTVLLPDGRVLTAGQDNGASLEWGEIFEPPYLFRGPRPTITDAPDSIVYGQSFDVETPDGFAIDSAVLVRLTSVTHSVNVEQRLVELAYTTPNAGRITAVAPPSPNHAPPGYYMLFILNDQGVPSVAEIIHVGPPAPADVDGDGDVDFSDLLAVVSAWGPCPAPPTPCPADVDGSGDVGFGDLLAVIAGWDP
ncbi:MAG: DUF1929 domain-containing protein, partial [Phycisphaerae bacterium]|nr:DUF1929 domain-containing protein [Phycisphaerae bacterium]